MIVFFMILGLIFLISGGVGLFHVNTHLVSGTDLWIYGNITFGTFAAFGIAILIFIAIFNAEFD